jgi:rhomboid protease GluP
MCPGCRALLAPEEASCPYCGWNVRQTEVRREGGLVERALKPLGGLIPVLLGANVLLYLGTVAAQAALVGAKGMDGILDAAMGPRGGVLVLLGANVPADVLRGQAWRLLCPVFLHGGLIHIAVNMMSLRNIGGVVVDAYGSGKALALYLLAGIAGNLASVAWFHWRGVDGEVPRIGASGAIFGVAGLIAALGFRIGGEQGKAFWKPMLQSIGLMLVLGFILSSAGGPILLDNTGHAGGFLFGLGAGWVATFGVRARGNLAAVRAWDTAAIVLSVLTVASFVPSALMFAEALSRRP